MRRPMKSLMIRAFGIALLLMTIFCQCEGSGQNKGKPNVIAIIVPSQENPFFKAEAEAAKDKAEDLGYQALILDHRDDPELQEKHFDTAIALKVSAIILDSVGILDKDKEGSAVSIAPIQRARDNGIPSFLINREIYESGVAVCQIIANMYQGAMLAAEEFVRLMQGTGNYVELLGRESDGMSIRSPAFHDAIDNYPDMKIVARQSANWSQDEAFTVIESIIAVNPDINGVICGNDTMALGAMAALKKAGLGDAIVVGIDGSDKVLESIKAGWIRATVMVPIERIAEMAVMQADMYLKTGSTGQPEKQFVDCELITAENADKYRTWRLVRPVE